VQGWHVAWELAPKAVAPILSENPGRETCPLKTKELKIQALKPQSGVPVAGIASAGQTPDALKR
jgi:hypothetical protein